MRYKPYSLIQIRFKRMEYGKLGSLFRIVGLGSLVQRKDGTTINMDSSISTTPTSSINTVVQTNRQSQDQTIIDVWTESGRRSHACGGNGGCPLPVDILV